MWKRGRLEKLCVGSSRQKNQLFKVSSFKFRKITQGQERITLQRGDIVLACDHGVSHVSQGLRVIREFHTCVVDVESNSVLNSQNCFEGLTTLLEQYKCSDQDYSDGLLRFSFKYRQVYSEFKDVGALGKITIPLFALGSFPRRTFKSSPFEGYNISIFKHVCIP